LSHHLTQSEFEEQARNFIEAQTGYSGEQIASDTDLVAEGIVDSLMLVEFSSSLRRSQTVTYPPRRSPRRRSRR
jgi:acyl carrier protein